ncbi:MAG TPA: ribonuclease III [Coriobacteriia bacterium]
MADRENSRQPQDPEERIDRAEEILGVTFADRGLLQRALTHPSYSFESGSKEQYERLEFLGDSVLGFLMTEHIYGRFPEFDEGRMAKLRAALVSGRTLAAIARDLGLGEALLVGHGADAGGARKLKSVLADAFEATLGALYLDAGIDAARGFVMRVFADRLAPEALATAVLDAKSELQERSMAEAGLTPVYRIVAEAGPPHDRTFTAEVLVGDRLLGQGSGATKKDAEKAAATEALDALSEVAERRS